MNNYNNGRQSNTQTMTVEEADKVVRRQQNMFTRLEMNGRQLAIYEGMESFESTWKRHRCVAVQNGVVISSSVYIAASNTRAV